MARARITERDCRDALRAFCASGGQPFEVATDYGDSFARRAATEAGARVLDVQRAPLGAGYRIIEYTRGGGERGCATFHADGGLGSEAIPARELHGRIVAAKNALGLAGEANAELLESIRFDLSNGAVHEAQVSVLRALGREVCA